MAAALFELDDVDGPVRDHVEAETHRLRSALAGYVREAIDTRERRADTDVDQVAWELQALDLGHHATRRFQRDPAATGHAMVVFEALVDRHRRP